MHKEEFVLYVTNIVKKNPVKIDVSYVLEFIFKFLFNIKKNINLFDTFKKKNNIL